MALLRIQVNALTKYKIRFDIDTDKSQVQVLRQWKEEEAGFFIQAGFSLRFHNTDASQLIVRKMELSLLKIDSSIPESTVLGTDQNLTAMRRDDKSRVNWTQGIVVDGAKVSPDYYFHYTLIIPSNCEPLTLEYFLRITMEATNQAPLPLDFDVDWESASNKDYGRVTLREKSS